MGQKKKGSAGNPSSGSTFQATKKHFVQSQKAGKAAVAKAQEAKRAAKQKNTRKHINGRANFVLDANLDRIDIKRKLQQLDKQRSLHNGDDVGQESTTTSPPPPPPPPHSTQPTTTKPLKTTDKTKSGGKDQEKGAKTEVPGYYHSGKTLILGDGDFSFTASLLQYRSADPQNIITTTYDTLQQVKYKYRDTYSKHLDHVHTGPTIVLNHIDATNISQSFPNPFTTNQFPPGVTPSPLQSVIKMQYPFDRILFNFPHSGEQRVHVNRRLLADFFVSARPHLSLPPELSYPIGNNPSAIAQRKTVDSMLDDVTGKLLPLITAVRKQYVPQAHKDGLHTDPFGRVLVVLRDGDPYDGWEIDVQAANGLYQLEAKVLWEPSWWKFYQHKTTDVQHSALEGGKAHIYIFKLTNIGVAMAMQEVQQDIHPLQDDRNNVYFENLKGKTAECMSFTNNSSVPTDPTLVDSKLHVSPWQNRAIVKAQNRIKQDLERANHDAAGKTTTQNGSDLTKLSTAQKRKANVLDSDEPGTTPTLNLSKEQQQTMADRFAAFAQDPPVEPTTTAVTTTKRTKKDKSISATTVVPEPIIMQPIKKQRIDVVMEGVSNSEKSKTLLDQLVQLDHSTPVPAVTPTITKKLSKKEQKQLEEQQQRKLQPEQKPNASSSSSLFENFQLDDLLALEADVAPELTKQRLDAAKDADDKKKAAKKAAEEAQHLEIEKERQRAETKAKLEQQKKDARKSASIAPIAVVDKKSGVPATGKKGKFDFSNSDDMDLSREIFAMLTGARPEARDTDDGDDGDDDYESDDSDDDSDQDTPRSTFGLGPSIAAVGTKPSVSKAVTLTKSKISANPQKAIPTKVAAKPTTSAPVSSFAGFGTGGLKTKTAEPQAETKISKPSASKSKSIPVSKLKKEKL